MPLLRGNPGDSPDSNTQITQSIVQGETNKQTQPNKLYFQRKKQGFPKMHYTSYPNCLYSTVFSTIVRVKSVNLGLRLKEGETAYLSLSWWSPERLWQ